MSAWKRLLVGFALSFVHAAADAQTLQVAFGETDITPGVAADETPYGWPATAKGGEPPRCTIL